MTYNPNIPSTGQSLGSSRPQVQTNFSLLKTTIDTDHVDMNDAGLGEHKQITFNANNIPGGLPVDPSSILFTKNNAAGHPYPFFLNSEAAAVINALPFLPDISSSGTNYSFQIGKIVFNFGFNVGGGSTSSVTYKTAFPSGSAANTVLISASSTDPSRLVSVNTSNNTAAGFEAKIQQVSTGFFYLAIGT